MDCLHAQISPGFRMPEPGIFPFPAVLQTAYSKKVAPPQKTRSYIGHAKLNGRTPNYLRLPAPSRHAQGPGRPCQCQNDLEADVQEGLAIFKPSAYPTAGQKARWAGGRAHSQSTLGLGLYGNPGMERGAPKARYDHRLRRQDDSILVAQETHDGRRHRRNAQRSHLCAFWPRENQGQGYRVPFRQRIDISIRSVQADVKALRYDCRTPIRSPESNGIAEAFFGTLKRDYVYQSCLETSQDVERQAAGWIKDYNEVAPHSALNMISSVKYHSNWISQNGKSAV